MNLIEQLQEDHKTFGITKELRLDEINGLGYIVSNRAITLGEPVYFQLVQLLEEDKKKPVDLCYLYHPKSDTGFIMPRSFEYYVKLVPKKKKEPEIHPNSRAKN